jgi:hypothetical protein
MSAGQTMNEEIKRSINGAVMLLRPDEAALARFNLTFEGFWRSFIAGVIAFPFSLALTALRTDRLAQADSAILFVLGEGLQFSVAWVVFPLLAIATTRFFGLHQRYVHYVVAIHWVQLVQVALISTIILILGPETAVGMFGLVILVFSLYYHWSATKVSLETTGGVAAGLVVLNELVVFLLHLFLFGAR